ncbi:flavin-containing monooxygenase [Phenylobacterium sp.]|jgi:cyclohexanone monooxygenase|uniref:flavin-containing monooxygenase n=1 Tax=Phenylobacterium sp. TaxID=1871053 RepID=UPI0037C6D252
MSEAGRSAETELGFDPAALRERYRAEREKRLRADGEAQYIELAGEFARYAEDDPYADPSFTRAPLEDEVEVAIIGGGFSGLLAGARLREAGIEDIRIIEAGADFGGTWYWNRYPGAQCDIESYCYLPLLEELRYVPKEKYSYVNEIFEHSQRVGRAYRLYDAACFQTRVRELRWDEGLRRWRIATNRGDDMKARFVIMALGTASRAKLPGIPGIESFAGHSFHTSRWDYGYTGGDTTGNLTGLADKRVAIIGTGATAIQCVPFVGRYAQHLHVFQRTPSSVDLRGNAPTDPEWAKTLEPGWQRARRKNFANIVEGKPFTEDLVNDGWTDIFRSLASGGALAEKLGIKADPMTAVELADFVKMNKIRARVDEHVADPTTAEALKPWYRQFCKRPTFNDEFLPTFNRPNVTLVDVSAAQGVERITPAGVVANGTEFQVDCIIYASGFEISTAFRRRIGFDIFGRGGLSLFDYYKDGFRTLHGHSSRNFPNWFYIGVGQNGLSVNMTAMFDDQAQHIAYIIKEARVRGATTVEPTPEAEEAWVETIRSVAILNRDFQNSCTPGYYNNEGGERSGGLNGQTYTPGINRFNALLAEWRAQGDMQGLELTP